MGILGKPYRAPARLQIVGNRGMIKGQQANGGGGGTNYTRAESRYAFMPMVDCCNLRLLYDNFYVGAGTGEFDGYNDITIEAGFEVSAVTTGAASQVAAFARAFFSGATSALIKPGASGVLTDPVGLYLPKGQQSFVRTGLTVASAGLLWPRGFIATLGGTAEQNIESTNAASQIAGTGVLATGASGAVASYGYGPMAILGYPSSRCMAVTIIGDSIAYGQNDANGGDGFGNRGWITRGLYLAGIPWANSSRPSDTPAQNKQSVAWRKHTPLAYSHWGLCEEIVNQLGPTSTAVTMEYLSENWKTIRASGNKVAQTLCMPQVTTTDGCATLSNQTVDSTFAANRAAANAAILVAWHNNQVDYVLDPATPVQDSSNPDKFRVDLGPISPDGTHLNSTGCALVASVSQAFGQSI